MQSNSIAVSKKYNPRNSRSLSHNPALASKGCNDTTEVRFWKYVTKTDSCWIWTGTKTHNGYGRMGKSGYKGILAHHVSWLLHKGIIPDGLKVLHDCPNGDRRDCVNPSHLWLGTIPDNQKDMVEKGRSTRGEKASNAKLTWKQVDNIRADYATGKYFHHQLAKKYGVRSQTIQRIVRGIRWKKDDAQYFVGKPRIPIGSEKPLSKLTDDAVKRIREAYKPRIYTLKQLAKEYGVTISTVHHVIAGNSWKHV